MKKKVWRKKTSILTKKNIQQEVATRLKREEFLQKQTMRKRKKQKKIEDSLMLMKQIPIIQE